MIGRILGAIFCCYAGYGLVDIYTTPPPGQFSANQEQDLIVLLLDSGRWYFRLFLVGILMMILPMFFPQKGTSEGDSSKKPSKKAK